LYSLLEAQARLAVAALGLDPGLGISGTQDEICNRAKLETLKGWCHIHDTLTVPNEAQSKIVASAGLAGA
jgi:hypothetical protein